MSVMSAKASEPDCRAGSASTRVPSDELRQLRALEEPELRPLGDELGVAAVLELELQADQLAVEGDRAIQVRNVEYHVVDTRDHMASHPDVGAGSCSSTVPLLVRGDTNHVDVADCRPALALRCRAGGWTHDPDRRSVRLHERAPAGQASVTVASTSTVSRTFRAPMKPLYGRIPHRLCWTLALAMTVRSSVACAVSRSGWVTSRSVSSPSTVALSSSTRTVVDTNNACGCSPVRRSLALVLLISRRSLSVSGLAPPCPSRTWRQRRSTSTARRGWLSGASGMVMVPCQRVASMTRSCPARAATPSPRTPARSAPATPPGPWRACATSPSASCTHVATDADEVRARIGLEFQDPSLNDQLTAGENLMFHAWVYGVSRATRRQRIDSYLETVGLADRAEAPTTMFGRPQRSWSASASRPCRTTGRCVSRYRMGRSSCPRSSGPCRYR